VVSRGAAGCRQPSYYYTRNRSRMYDVEIYRADVLRHDFKIRSNPRPDTFVVQNRGAVSRSSHLIRLARTFYLASSWFRKRNTRKIDRCRTPVRSRWSRPEAPAIKGNALAVNNKRTEATDCFGEDCGKGEMVTPLLLHFPQELFTGCREAGSSVCNIPGRSPLASWSRR
jgi:hypothetical protein